MSKVWKILKRFAGTFRQAQTLKLRGMLYHHQRHHILQLSLTLSAHTKSVFF